MSEQLEMVVVECEGADYLHKSLGIKTQLIRPKREGKDKEMMEGIISLERLVNDIWRVYWIGRDAKRTNQVFQDLTVELFKLLGVVGDPQVLNLETHWNHMKSEVLTEEKIKFIGKTTKHMTQEQKNKIEKMIGEVCGILDKF